MEVDPTMHHMQKWIKVMNLGTKTIRWLKDRREMKTKQTKQHINDNIRSQKTVPIHATTEMHFELIILGTDSE